MNLSLVAITVFFAGLILFVSPSYGSGETGSIQVNVFYSNGDRVSNDGQVMKIYQDNNPTVYRIVEPDSYPITIDSLPIGHKYKIDIYRQSMYGTSEYVDLKDNFEKIDTSIPLDAGLGFQIFYKDGVTPVPNVNISIKAYDGMQWDKGGTDEKGNSKRFWLQSTVKPDNYYTAIFSIGSILNYTYPAHIILNPGYKSDIKIVTPWPTVVDQVVVSVYKTAFDKLTTEDGKYMIVLTDNDGNHIADSNVDSRGQAHFSNLKVLGYAVHVIKGTQGSQLGQEIGISNIVITGEQPEVSIFLKDITTSVPIKIQNGTVEYKINETTYAKLPQMINRDSCNCVIFRLDDVQDHFVRSSDLAILNLFALKHKDLTLGIVSNYTGKDKAIVDTVQQGIHKNLFTPAIHGYDHIDYTLLPAFEQYQSLKMANDKIDSLFGSPSDIFIPPYNHFNNVTIDVLKKLGVRVLSAGSVIDQEVWHYSKDHRTSSDPSYVYHIPQESEFPFSRAVEINYFSSITEDEIFKDINSNLKKVGYSVVTLHPQDITLRDSHGKLINTNNSLNQTAIYNLGHLIDRLEAKNYTITNYYDLAGLPAKKFPLLSNSSYNNQDQSVTNIFTLGKGSTGVAINPSTDMVYVTNSKSDSVSVIDGKTGSVYGTIDVGNIPIGISINTKTNMIYVVNSYAGTVSVINGATNTVSDTLKIGTIAYGVDVNPKSNLIYFIDPYIPAIDFVDGNTNQITSTVKLDGSPQRISVNPSTNMIYVTNSKSDSISVIDGSTRNVVGTIELGNNDTPLAISVNPSTNMIYVTNSKSDSISVIDGSTRNVVNTIKFATGDFPSGITVNDATNRIYVANLKSGTLGIIDSTMHSNSKATIPEFNLTTLLIFSMSISILLAVTRLKMVNLRN